MTDHQILCASMPEGMTRIQTRPDNQHESKIFVNTKQILNKLAALDQIYLEQQKLENLKVLVSDDTYDNTKMVLTKIDPGRLQMGTCTYLFLKLNTLDKGTSMSNPSFTT